MKNYLIKYLVKWLQYEIIRETVIDQKSLQDWLFESFSNKGFKQYYTARIKQLSKETMVGVEERDYWIHIGQQREMKVLNASMNEEFNRRRKQEEKERLAKQVEML